MKNNQKGFSVIPILIVVVVIGVAGAVAWRISDSRKENSKQESTQQILDPQPKQPHTLEDKEAQSWKQVTSAQKGFDVRIPDGWEVLNYNGSENIRSQKLAYQPGKEAKVETIGNPYAGDSLFRLNILQFKESDQPHLLDGDEEKQSFDTDSLQGTRYYKKYPVKEPQGVGPYPGMEAYTYEFKKNGKLTYVVYNVFNDNQYIRQILSDFTTGDKNQVELVERMVKTLEIK